MEELTKKQKEFANEYLETGNGTQSALKVYNTDKESTAAVIAHENLRKLKIQEYLADKAEVAASNIYELANNAENESVKLNANKDILDRAGFKPTDKTDITTNGKELPNPILQLDGTILSNISNQQDNSPKTED